MYFVCGLINILMMMLCYRDEAVVYIGTNIVSNVIVHCMQYYFTVHQQVCYTLQVNLIHIQIIGYRIVQYLMK